MSPTISYPGVYIEEIPSGVRAVTGVGTSNTAFIGYFTRGPMNEAVRMTSPADFDRTFGGLDSASDASYQVKQYFLNGGRVAFVVRVVSGVAAKASLTLQGGSPFQDTLVINASSEGEWGSALRVAITVAPADDELFNLTVREVVSSNGYEQVAAEESFIDLSMDSASPRFVEKIINSASTLIKVHTIGTGVLPLTSSTNTDGSIPDVAFQLLSGGSNGNEPDALAIEGSAAAKTGLYTLDKLSPGEFNILCIPAAAELTTGYSAVITQAADYCRARRAFLIIDIPRSVATYADMLSWASETGDQLRSTNAAVYFPRLNIADPLKDNKPRNIAVSGTIAGLYARTDAARGVWKAPAGKEAVLHGVSVTAKLTDAENGQLNPLGVNAIRIFPAYGNVCWGSRTMYGADAMASEWKYIPVRRTALYIEESLYQGLQWTVFEANEETLWAQIRLTVDGFMHTLFRQGAFQGASARDAYFVKCDSETTTQNDINAGKVNIVVGFAMLKPAEFVVITIRLIAGQVQRSNIRFKSSPYTLKNNRL
jgi:phage tail sheath protein FI